MRGTKKISVLGLLLGLVWAATVILVVIGIYNMKNVTKYAPDVDTMVYEVDRQDYVQLRKMVTNSRSFGFSEETDRIYAEVYAVADYVDAYAFLYAYTVAEDEERVKYYANKAASASLSMEKLGFTEKEFEDRFFH